MVDQAKSKEVMLGISLTAIIVVALATWQAVEIYRHSSLFEEWRAATKPFEDTDWFFKLLGCGWCLSVWVAAFLFIAVYVPPFNWVVAGLAISRIANIFHDVYRYLETRNDWERDAHEQRLIWQQQRQEELENQKQLNTVDDKRKDV